VTTGVHAAIDVDSDLSRAQGFNVVARLGGADSAARREQVVLAAPYVRLDSDAGFWRDSASASTPDVAGAATLMAAAAGATRFSPAPRRPVVFVATAGRPGAEYFAAQARDRTAAVVHLEGAPARTVGSLAVLGADRSTLGEMALAAAQAEDAVLGTAGDSEADFLASGAFPYTATGAPVLDLRPDGSARTARLALRIVWTVATGTQFPAWLPGMEPPTARRRADSP
jgi:hypothetical protein